MCLRSEATRLGGLEEEKTALLRPLKEGLELTAKEREKGIYGRGISANSGSDIHPPFPHSADPDSTMLRCLDVPVALAPHESPRHACVC